MLSPISLQNPKQTEQKAPERPHHHLPTAQHDRDHNVTQAKMSARPTKRQHTTPPKPPTPERNSQKPTDAPQPATAHPSILCVSKFEPTPPSDRSLDARQKFLISLHIYILQEYPSPNSNSPSPTLDKEAYN